MSSQFTPHVDLALARRLERTEGAACAAYVEARRQLEPESGATWIEVAGAYAMFDALGSPITQTFGLGVFEPFAEREFDAVETFFRGFGSDTFHEVSALAPRESTDLLRARGYEPIEESVVLVRPTAGFEMPETQVRVRVVTENEFGLWARTAGIGWSSESAELAEFVEGFGRTMARARGMTCFLAELDGAPVAAAGLNLGSGIALMAGASTIPSARGRGAQLALLAARLDHVARLGIDLAMVVTQPESASQRNAERRGFRPVYGRTKWRLGTGPA